MIYSNFAPVWFYGYDIALELVFFATSLMVAIFAFNIYKKTCQKKIRLFGVGFSLIATSYLIQSILNFLIITKANEQVCRAIKVSSILAFNYTGTLIHIFFLITGYAILLYTTLKINSRRTLWLLILISIVTVFFSKNILFVFYLLSTIYLLFISTYYIKNYLKNKQTKTLLIAVAFLFLLFGSFHFLISVNHQLFYAIGHILELFAYILILSNLYLIFKK